MVKEKEIVIKKNELSKVIEENLRYNYCLKSVEDLIENSKNINHCPHYQRNYVWDAIKASFFIESMLLDYEIPPLIVFKNSNILEVIDGRQRFETLLRFFNNELKLHGKGLMNLKHLAGKYYKDLEEIYKNNFKRCQLRIYEYELHHNVHFNIQIADELKREIFTRYNSGFIPLTEIEVVKAKYIYNSLNTYIKDKIENNHYLFNDVISIFGINSFNIQIVLKRLRHLLVLHMIPIYKYTANKSEINIIYDHYSLSVHRKEFDNIFNKFNAKLEYLRLIKAELKGQLAASTGQVFECLFWALAICNEEKVTHEKINSEKFKKKLVHFIAKNLNTNYTNGFDYKLTWINNIYENIANFFSSEMNVDFHKYLRSNQVFRSFFNDLIHNKKERDNDTIINNFSCLKKDALHVTVISIIKEIELNSYIVSPHYQRGDVIDRAKSSAIIESLLLSLQIPPIYIYKRKDGMSEILDGKQRILSILSFMGISYPDEHGNLIAPKKNKFKLHLKGAISDTLHNKRFHELSTEQQDKIKNSFIQIVEIREENNPFFLPTDQFIRLNYKPYPIKPNTFELWNSLANRKITDRVKKIYNSNNAWFYCVKKNERMNNEELITRLIYLQYKLNDDQIRFDQIRKIIAMSIISNRLHLRFSIKNDITDVLMSPITIPDWLIACDQFENEFLAKIKLLLPATSDTILSKELNDLLFSDTERKSRTSLRFYILWITLSNISKNTINKFHYEIRQDIVNMLNKIAKVKRPDQFESLITTIWNKYAALKK